MDRKPFPVSPPVTAAGQLDDLDDHRESIRVLSEELGALKQRIKQQLEEKQVCARRFGEAKAAGAPVEPLRQLMQQVSGHLKELETRRKELEGRLHALEQGDGSGGFDTAPGLPERFIAAERNIRAQGDITIEALDDAQAGYWDDYVAAHPKASLYHRYAWRQVIRRAFGHETLYLGARDSTGRLVGVLPIVRLKSRLFGDFGVSMPFFNYGGVLADHPDIAEQLLNRAADEARQRGLSHLEIRSTYRACDWPARTDKVSMILELPASADQLEKQLGAKIRAQIKRARQENPQLVIGGKELLDDFYRVFATNMRDLGTPVYGKAFFRIILEAWPEQARLVVLRMAGRPVATAFLLGDRDMMEIPWASTLRSANPLNMNMLLYWHVLQFSLERGYRYFDFGRSTQDAGTFRFKKQWGAIPVQHFWHYWLIEGTSMPQLKPDSPKFRFLVKCWQKLPVALTRLLGPAIVRYLP